MIAILFVALLVLALLTSRAMDKASESEAYAATREPVASRV